MVDEISINNTLVQTQKYQKKITGNAFEAEFIKSKFSSSGNLFKNNDGKIPNVFDDKNFKTSLMGKSSLTDKFNGN